MDIFQKSYQAKGNIVLKKAIVKYIIQGSTPLDVSLDKLQHLAKTLEPEEKVS